MNAKTTQELLTIMNTGFIRSEIAAATAEYWRRVEAGEHTRPAAVGVIEAESPESFTRRMLSKLH